MNNACYVAPLAYLYTRPRLSDQSSFFSLSPPLSLFPVDNKGLIISLNTESYPGHHSEAVYCIVNRFNSRVQLLRTKQRVFRIRRNVGCCCRASWFPPSDTSIKYLLTQRLLLSISSHGLFSLCSPPLFAYCRLSLWPTTYSFFLLSLSLFTSLSRLNRVNYLRRHLTIFYHGTGTDKHQIATVSVSRRGRRPLVCAMVILCKKQP